MNPDKVKKIGFAALGVWVLLAGGLGYLAYDAAASRTEAEDTLEEENSAFRRFNDAPVFPSAASIDSVKSNEMAWGAWYDAAFALAGRGDKDFSADPPSPSAFKQRLQSTVRKLQSLPGEVDGKIAVVEGVRRLTGARVCATDLRGGAAVVIAGLMADGTTEIENIDHIERGYERIIEKLTGVGADIRRVTIPDGVKAAQ